MGLFRSLFSSSERGRSQAREPEPAEALDAVGRVLLLEAQWTPGQKAEYAALGPEVAEAHVAFHEGELVRAHRLFEALLARSRAPRWLLRDVARARYAVADLAGAEASMRRFLELLGEELTQEASLEAAIDLARIHDERGEVGEAIETLSGVVERADGSSAQPYLALGRYLRQQGMLDEAFEVLEAALPIEACCGGGCGKGKEVERELGAIAELRRRAGNDRGALR